MEKISWPDYVRNVEVLRRVYVCTYTLRKAIWIYHILSRSCLLKHIIEGNIEVRIKVTGRRGRRHKQLMDDLKETRGYRKLKQEALNHTCGELALKRLRTYH